jgi:hypothetical protein
LAGKVCSRFRLLRYFIFDAITYPIFGALAGLITASLTTKKEAQ